MRVWTSLSIWLGGWALRARRGQPIEAREHDVAELERWNSTPDLLEAIEEDQTLLKQWLQNRLQRR